MLGNVNVCLHTWPGNAGMNYEMGGTILRKTVEGKILRPMGNNGCTGVARIFVWGGGLGRRHPALHQSCKRLKLSRVAGDL